MPRVPLIAVPVASTMPTTPKKSEGGRSGSNSGTGKGNLRNNHGNNSGGSPRSLRRVRSRENLHSRVESINWGGPETIVGSSTAPSGSRNTSDSGFPTSKIPTMRQHQHPHSSKITTGPTLGPPFDPSPSPKENLDGDMLIVSKTRLRQRRGSVSNSIHSAIPVSNSRRNSKVLTGLDLDLVRKEVNEAAAATRPGTKSSNTSVINYRPASSRVPSGFGAELLFDQVLIVKDPEVESKTKIPRPV